MGSAVSPARGGGGQRVSISNPHHDLIISRVILRGMLGFRALEWLHRACAPLPQCVQQETLY